jgi:hypothetical protein
VKTGTLVDATIIASASITKDDEAYWVGHRPFLDFQDPPDVCQ